MSQTERIKPAAFEQTVDGDKSIQRLSSAQLIADFAKSAIQTGLISPLWNGAAGAISFGHLPQVSIVDSQSARTNPAEATAQSLGAVAGLVADAFILSKMHGLFSRATAAEAASNHSLSLLAPESAKLATETPLERVSDQFTAQGTSFARIKRHIADEANPAAKYIARVIKENDVTIIGEFHNKRGPSPHRLLGVEALSEMPPGSTFPLSL